MLNFFVVGVGAIGRNHARILADLSGVRLAGVVDADIEAARAIAARYGVRAYASCEDLLQETQADAAVVAVPTAWHESISCSLMQRGIHVLVEKPIAPDLAAADRIIECAAANKTVLGVGHVERFNPAVLALKQKLNQGDLGRIFHIEARRQGPFPSRIQDVGVVIDLAVHDLDLIRFVCAREIEDVAAITARRVHESHEDFVRATLRIADGVVGTLTIDWLTPTKIRELFVTGERGMFRVDLLTQDLFFFENAAVPDIEWNSLEVLRGISEGRMIRYVVAKKEPLRAELEAFCQSIRERTAPPVGGVDGRFAVALARALIDSGQSRSVVAVHAPSVTTG